jgi:hypothetical protein
MDGGCSLVEQKRFSIAKAWRFVWDSTSRNLVFYLAAMLILLLPLNLLYFLQGVLRQRDYSGPLVLANLMSLLVIMVVFSSFIKIGLCFSAGERAGFSDIGAAINHSWRYFLGYILYILIVIAGSIMFIVPGIIWAVKYQFFGYFIIDQGMKPREALTRSGQITEGQKGHIFVFDLLYMIISSALIYPLYFFVSRTASSVVGSVVATFFLIALAYVYQSLLATEDEQGITEAPISSNDNPNESSREIAHPSLNDMSSESFLPVC